MGKMEKKKVKLCVVCKKKPVREGRNFKTCSEKCSKELKDATLRKYRKTKKYKKITKRFQKKYKKAKKYKLYHRIRQRSITILIRRHKKEFKKIFNEMLKDEEAKENKKI